MWDCPAEARMTCYSLIQKQPKNLIKVHPFVDNLIVATATGKDIPKPAELTAKVSATTTTTDKKPSTRGAKKKTV
jgi:hypothetical protein